MIYHRPKEVQLDWLWTRTLNSSENPVEPNWVDLERNRTGNEATFLSNDVIDGCVTVLALENWAQLTLGLRRRRRPSAYVGSGITNYWVERWRWQNLAFGIFLYGKMCIWHQEIDTEAGFCGQLRWLVHRFKDDSMTRVRNTLVLTVILQYSRDFKGLLATLSSLAGRRDEMQGTNDVDGKYSSWILQGTYCIVAYHHLYYIVLTHVFDWKKCNSIIYKAPKELGINIGHISVARGKNGLYSQGMHINIINSHISKVTELQCLIYRCDLGYLIFEHPHIYREVDGSLQRVRHPSSSILAAQWVQEWKWRSSVITDDSQVWLSGKINNQMMQLRR